MRFRVSWPLQSRRVGLSGRVLGGVARCSGSKCFVTVIGSAFIYQNFAFF